MNDEGFKDFVLDQLHGLRGVSCRAMFGGYGLYCGEQFFAIIHRGRLYFKTDEASRATYLKKGMKPFRPNAKQTLKTYYEVPVEIIEDQEHLIAWGQRALHDQDDQKSASPRKDRRSVSKRTSTGR